MAYPTREPFYVAKYLRRLIRSYVAQEVGSAGFCLLAVVAVAEDEMRYSGPVRYWNEDLAGRCGLSSAQFRRVRQRVVDAGWLHYEKGGRGKAGEYWVTIPDSEENNCSPVSTLPNNCSLSCSSTCSPVSTYPTGKENPDSDVTPASGRTSDENLDGGGTQHPLPIPSIPLSPVSNGKFPVFVKEILDYYGNLHPRAKPDSKVKRLILDRFKDGYSVDDLKAAIDGCHRCPWNCGDNPQGKRYQSLELIVRSAANVQRFMEEPEASGPVLSERSRRSRRAAESFLEKWESEDDANTERRD